MATARRKSPKPKARARSAAPRKQAAPKRFRRLAPARREAILAGLAEHIPHPRCALDHANSYELVVATILSAQCTDVRVNMVTPALFARYPRPADLGAATQEDVEELIHSTGFFRNKAKNLIGMAQRVVEEFGGEIPASMDHLLTLPGVARKTANVVLGECFGIADGIVVDTHVGRLARRMGFTDETDPVKVERDLMKLVPRDQWIATSHRLILHGRSLCDARKPRCDECYLADPCPRIDIG